MTRAWLFALLVLMSAAQVSAAAVADFPNKPIRIIVPFPPGGNTDYVARVIAPFLEQNLGQGILIDNRSGAQGVLGVQIGAQALKDGYTLTLSDAATVIAPALMDMVPFDVLRDFVPVGMLIEQPYVVTVNSTVPANTFTEFVKYVQANPNRLNFGSGAAIGHVSQEVLYSLAGLKMTHIPFRGTAPLMTSLLGNEVQVTLSGPGSVIPQVRAGKLKALAVTTLKRIREMPDVPTIDEQGFKGFEIRGWYGLLAPVGTPRAAITRLNAELNRVLTASPAAQTLRERGYEPAPVSPEAFGALLRSEIVRWSQAVRKYNVRQAN